MRYYSQKFLFYSVIIMLLGLMSATFFTTYFISRNIILNNVSKIKALEMSEFYSSYVELETQSNSKIDTLANMNSVQNYAYKITTSTTNLESDEKTVKEFATLVEGFSAQMDIYLITNNYIIQVSKKNDETQYSAEKIDYNSFSGIANGIDFAKKIAINDLDYQHDFATATSIVIRELDVTGATIIGVPQYRKVLSGYDNPIAIYDSLDSMLLMYDMRLSPLNILGKTKVSTSSYKVIKSGNNTKMLCYFYPEGDKGYYCVTTLDYYDVVLSFNELIWINVLISLIIFCIMCYVYWAWSSKIVEPLNSFNHLMDLSKQETELNKIDVEKGFSIGAYNLRARLNGYYTSTIIPVFIACLIVVVMVSTQLNRDMEQYYHSVMKYEARAADITLKNARQFPLILNSQQDILNILYDAAGNLSDEEKKEISHIMFTNSSIGYDVNNIRLISQSGRVIYSSNGNYSYSSQIDFLDEENQYKWDLNKGVSSPVLYHIAESKNGEIIGYYEIEYGDLLSNLATGFDAINPIRTYLVSESKDIFVVNTSKGMTKENIEQLIEVNHSNESLRIRDSNKTVMVLSSANMYDSNFKLSYAIPVVGYLKGYLNENYQGYLILFIAMIVIAVILAVYLGRKVLRPVIELSNSIYDNHIKTSLNEIVYGQNEFRLLANRFNIMTEQINDYAVSLQKQEQERSVIEERRREAEIIALQTQINPHFLYNTFTSIAVLIRSGKTNEAAQMVLDTGNLMRLGVYRGHLMVPLQEEIEHVNQYIRLQRIRFPNRILIYSRIPDAIMQIKVVKFILQPIIENSIEHGLEERPGAILEINIDAKVYGKDLYIYVSDDGGGIKEEELDILQRELDECDMTRHLGLSNVNERIKLNCGADYGLTLENYKNGLQVKIKIPVATND